MHLHNKGKSTTMQAVFFSKATTCDRPVAAVLCMSWNNMIATYCAKTIIAQLCKSLPAQHRVTHTHMTTYKSSNNAETEKDAYHYL
jgi:hypothetical protein